jgi:hypothetical protein
MMREAHELILLYCEETQQFPIYKAEPWFQFARVLRNVMSHGLTRRAALLESGPTTCLKRASHL